MRARSALWRGAALTLAMIGATGAATADTVHMTAAYYSDQTQPYLERMAAEFHGSAPSNDIKIDVVRWGDLRHKLETDIAAGTNPDVAIIATPWLVDFVRHGQVAVLDTLMSPEFRGRLIGSLLPGGQIGGKTYGLPISATARGLFYNKDLLAKVGVTAPPATWDEVMEDAARLKAAGVAGFGLQGKGPETDVYWYYALWTEGGEIVGPDAKAAFASPAGIKALTLYKTMIDQGLTEAEPTTYAREDLQGLFKHGQVAMIMSGPWLINQLAGEAPGLNYGIAPVPRGTRAATFAVTDSVVIFSNSKVKDAAWNFVNFLFTREPRVEFDRNEGFLPTTKPAAADPYFTKNERLNSLVKLLPSAHLAPTMSGWDAAAKAVSDAVQSVYLGEARPDEALKAAAAAADVALGK